METGKRRNRLSTADPPDGVSSVKAAWLDVELMSIGARNLSFGDVNRKGTRNCVSERGARV